MSVVFEVFKQARHEFHSMAAMRDVNDELEAHQELAAAAEQTIKHLLIANGQLIPAAAEKEAIGRNSATEAILEHAGVVEEERAAFFRTLEDAIDFRIGNAHLPFSPLTHQKLLVNDRGEEQQSTEVGSAELTHYLSAASDTAPQAALDDARQLTRALSTIVALRKYSTMLNKDYDSQEWNPVIEELKSATRQAFQSLKGSDIPEQWVENYVGAVERTTSDVLAPTPKIQEVADAEPLAPKAARARVKG